MVLRCTEQKRGQFGKRSCNIKWTFNWLKETVHTIFMLRFQEQLNLLRATDLSETHVFKQFKKFSESWLANSTITNQHPIQTFTREVNIFIDYDLLPAFKRLEDFIMLEYRQVQCEQKRRSKSQLQISKQTFSVNARRSSSMLYIYLASMSASLIE